MIKIVKTFNKETVKVIFFHIMMRKSIKKNICPLGVVTVEIFCKASELRDSDSLRMYLFPDRKQKALSILSGKTFLRTPRSLFWISARGAGFWP